MPHPICCQHPRDVSSPTPPARPHQLPQIDSVLDGTFTLGLLPDDHPHSRRVHLSPVDFCILKSPKVVHKIKNKLNRKSSRNLRKELKQLHDDPYATDAHTLTSSEVVTCAGLETIAMDGTLEEDTTRPSMTTYRSFYKRFGTLDETLHRSRPNLYSPSIYSRSPSRLDGDRSPQPPPSTTPKTNRRRTRVASTDFDYWGRHYRLFIPRRPSLSTFRRQTRSQSQSRHLSVSTDSTVRGRLEESGVDESHDSHLYPDGDGDDERRKAVALDAAMKERLVGHMTTKHLVLMQREVSLHMEDIA